MNSRILGRLMKLEFIFNKQMIAFTVVMVLAMAAFYPMLLGEVSVAVAVGVLYLALVPVSIMARSSKFRSDALVCALPVRRSTIVLGKYLFIGAVAGVLFLAYLAVLIIAPYEGFTPRAVVDFDRMVNSVLAMAVVGGLLIPLILRFGYTGVVYFLLGVNLLTVLLFMFTAIGGAGNILDFIFNGVPETIRSIRGSLGPVWYPIAAFGAACMFQYLSYRVSAVLFVRREL